MFDLKAFIVTNIVNGVKNGTFTKEYGNIMAVNYMVKNVIAQDDVESVSTQIESWEAEQAATLEPVDTSEETTIEDAVEEVSEESTEEVTGEESGETAGDEVEESAEETVEDVTEETTEEAVETPVEESEGESAEESTETTE